MTIEKFSNKLLSDKDFWIRVIKFGSESKYANYDTLHEPALSIANNIYYEYDVYAYRHELDVNTMDAKYVDMYIMPIVEKFLLTTKGRKCVDFIQSCTLNMNKIFGLPKQD